MRLGLLLWLVWCPVFVMVMWFLCGDGMERFGVDRMRWDLSHR